MNHAYKYIINSILFILKLYTHAYLFPAMLNISLLLLLHIYIAFPTLKCDESGCPWTALGIDPILKPKNLNKKLDRRAAHDGRLQKIRSTTRRSVAEFMCIFHFFFLDFVEVIEEINMKGVD